MQPSKRRGGAATIHPVQEDVWVRRGAAAGLHVSKAAVQANGDVCVIVWVDYDACLGRQCGNSRLAIDLVV